MVDVFLSCSYNKGGGDGVYRVKQQVKARMLVIQDEHKKQVFEDVYEHFIGELTFRIKNGILDGELQPYKIYIDVDLLGAYGLQLVTDLSLRHYLEEKGVPVLDVGWERVRYDWDTSSGTVTEWLNDLHEFYIEVNMIKIWDLALERE